MSDLENRRRFLTQMIAVTSVCAAPAVCAGEWDGWEQQQGAAPSMDGSQEFWNAPRILHLARHQNNESVSVSYWRDGQLDINGYRQVCWLMRDIRANEYAQIDLRLLDLLCAMQAWVSYYGYRQPFRVTSGYRTRGTNDSLEGAARHSMHLYGRAADIVFPDLPVSYLGQLAQHYSAGGVGFYPSSGFVHIDTGRIRSWGRR